jgi:hypothetical protein
MICEAIREEFGLDRILFVPAQIPPIRTSTGSQRLSIGWK